MLISLLTFVTLKETELRGSVVCLSLKDSVLIDYDGFVVCYNDDGRV